MPLANKVIKKQRKETTDDEEQKEEEEDVGNNNNKHCRIRKSELYCCMGFLCLPRSCRLNERMK